MDAIRRLWGVVWADVRRGRNVELYILVAVAVVLVLLNVLNLASLATTATATVAVLTLLGIAMLRIQHQMAWLEKIAGNESLAERFFRPDDQLDEIRDSIRSARTVWLWGSTLAQHIPALSGLIAECVERNGLTVKVLLLKPSSHSIEMAAFRSNGTEAAALDQDLAFNIERLRRDVGAQHWAAAIEVRTIDYLAPYVLYAYDPLLPTGETNPDGRIELRLSVFRGSHYRRPSFSLTGSGDQTWYAHFCDEFTKVWTAADPV